MPFPFDPHQGEKYKYLGYTFEYDSTLQAWVPEGMERPVDMTGMTHTYVATTAITSGNRSNVAIVKEEDVPKFTKMMSIEFERHSRYENLRWRYERNARETRLGMAVSDDIAKLDAYAQALADITKQDIEGDITWPVLDV